PLMESVCVCYGGIDSYDFHGYETAQCMSERRAGGECGLKSVHAAKGEKIWEMLRSHDRTKKLLLSALARSHNCKAPPGYTYPVERTLITTGMTISEVESLYRGQVAIQTPEMKVVYRAPPISSYWTS